MFQSCNPFFDADRKFSIWHMIGHVKKQYEFFSFFVDPTSFS